MGDQIEYRSVAMENLEVRASADSPQFAGYLCRYNIRDTYGTEFAPGCFAAGGLQERYALLWMHDEFSPVGTFTAREDETGLYIEGRYDDTPEGQAARARALSGSASELSVGFRRMSNSPDDENVITGASVVEGSQITRNFASQPGAALAEVRTKDSVNRRRALARLRLSAARTVKE